MSKVYQGFTSTYHSDWSEKFWTARDGNFDHGHTTIADNFAPGTEGADATLTITLEQIDKHRDELIGTNKQLNVYMEWSLTDDRRDYATVKLLRTELVERGDDE